jgi:deoxyribonuclease V
MKITSLHEWEVSPREAMQIQRELQGRLTLRDAVGPIRMVAGADVALDKQEPGGCAGVIVYSFPDLREIERQSARAKVSFPYVPGLLAFREAPVLLAAFEKLHADPDLIMFDAQGLAHQRRFGLACHLGLALDKPAIGCAKSRLVGEFEEPGNEVGDYSPLYDGGEVVGAVLRTRRNVHPIFVSQGHKVSLATCLQVVLKCLDGYRIPKPTREADHFVAMVKSGRVEPERPPSLFPGFE